MCLLQSLLSWEISCISNASMPATFNDTREFDTCVFGSNVIIMYCSWSTAYEDLLLTNDPFSEPIPLPVSFSNPLQNFKLVLLVYICKSYSIVKIIRESAWEWRDLEQHFVGPQVWLRNSSFYVVTCIVLVCEKCELRDYFLFNFFMYISCILQEMVDFLVDIWHDEGLFD